MTTTPKMPNAKSLEGAALYLLLQEKKISHLDFQDNSRSYCLRQPIHMLRGKGWAISDEEKPGGISRYSGRRTRYKVYYLDPEKIEEVKKDLGERLDKFVTAFEGGMVAATPQETPRALSRTLIRSLHQNEQ